jgi:hypothetical protein
MNIERSAEELIVQIEAAFRDIPYPDEKVLVVDDHSHLENCDDCQLAQGYFAERAWQELVDDVGMVSSLICFLNHSAWHYFLPAHLVGNVRAKKYDIFHLQLHDDGDESYRAWEEARFNRLNHLQTQAVIKYVEASITTHDQIGYLYSKRDQYLEALEYWRKKLEQDHDYYAAR